MTSQYDLPSSSPFPDSYLRILSVSLLELARLDVLRHGLLVASQ